MHFKIFKLDYFFPKIIYMASTHVFDTFDQFWIMKKIEVKKNQKLLFSSFLFKIFFQKTL